MVTDTKPMRERIVEAARDELADVGPGALSMRAVARGVGVTVGALYRHVDGRDALLTELIIEAYESVGAAAERGGAGSQGAEAWLGAAAAVRAWSLEHPHEFALIYGTPVIGYDAPAQTVGSATRIIRALVALLEQSDVSEHAGREDEPLPSALGPDVDRIRAWVDTHFPELGAERVPGRILLRVVRAWTELIGTISFELHGHYRGSVEDGAAYLEMVARDQARGLGLH